MGRRPREQRRRLLLARITTHSCATGAALPQDLAAGWERRVTSSVRLLVSKLQLVQLRGSFKLPGGAAKPATATPSKSPSKSPSKKATAASPKPAPKKKVPASAVKKVVGKKPSGAAKKMKQAARKA